MDVDHGSLLNVPHLKHVSLQGDRCQQVWLDLIPVDAGYANAAPDLWPLRGAENPVEQLGLLLLCRDQALLLLLLDLGRLNLLTEGHYGLESAHAPSIVAVDMGIAKVSELVGDLTVGKRLSAGIRAATLKNFLRKKRNKQSQQASHLHQAFLTFICMFDEWRYNIAFVSFSINSFE